MLFTAALTLLTLRAQSRLLALPPPSNWMGRAYRDWLSIRRPLARSVGCRAGSTRELGVRWNDGAQSTRIGSEGAMVFKHDFVVSLGALAARRSSV
jgi:hypothetical protein